jgi:phenylpropionate dioxygenase-like ring-hydroxylating dioxygenase large terminal subunit
VIAGTNDAKATSDRFVRNCWQVAAFADELKADFVARRFLDEPLILFRTNSGEVAALEDRCPHRLVPLSIGKRVGDAIQCGYHGTVVGSDGRCLRIPGQQHIPPTAATRSYPALARHGLVWIWMGDAALADPALVPDLHWLDHPEWATARGYIHMEADYRLVTDNLLDLSHETYIHETSIGNRAAESIADFTPTVTIERDRIVRSRRDMHGIDPPPAWVAWCNLSGKIDRLQIASYFPPGINMTEAGYRGSGTPGDDYTFLGRVMHLLTPESARSTHYFFTQSRRERLDDDAFTQSTARGTLATFTEDKFVLEMQQRAIEELGHPRVPHMTIALDAAPIQGRRLLDALIERERADPKAVVATFSICRPLDRPEAALAPSSA